MCSISGIATRDPAALVDAATVARMSASLAHRGPDGRGEFIAAGVGLAARRLGIIDLEGGDQPITNEDASVVVVCNGEIYNHRELRRELEERGHRFRSDSDVEVLVHLYAQCGVEMLRRLRGMFALALWDTRRRRLLLARDRLGIKPLLYSERTEGLYFASEMKALRAVGAVEGRIDREGFAELLWTQYTTPPRQLMEGVRTLPPGHYLLHEEGRARLVRYWEPSFPERGSDDRSRTAADWSEALREKLHETTKIHLRSDVPVCAVLSAGIDSSAVAALAQRELGDPLRTFSIAFEDPAYDELAQGTLATMRPGRFEGHVEVCGAKDLALLPTMIWHNEGVRLSSNGIARLVLARAIADAGWKVALAGEGADEVLGGYRWYPIMKLRPFLERIPASLRRFIAKGRLRRWRPGFAQVLGNTGHLHVDTYRTLSSPLRRSEHSTLTREFAHTLGPVSPELHPPPPPEFGGWEPFCQQQYIDMHTRMLAINAAVDNTSMAYGVEMRLPFLDHEFVEFCSRIPVEFKMKGRHEKQVLREAMSAELPKPIVDRRKRGLRAPAGEWLRGPLPSFASELLSERALRDTGYFDATRVVGMLRRHRAEEQSHGTSLWRILCVQIWHEFFIRGRRLSEFA